MAEQCTGRGRDGVVSAAAPLAAQAGAAALRDGGNAFDAVVAAALAETVLLPSKCGLGGDLVAIVLAPGAGDPEALLAIGGAPAGLAEVAEPRRVERHRARRRSARPAAPAGYVALAARGRLRARPPRRAGDRARDRRLPVGCGEPSAHRRQPRAARGAGTRTAPSTSRTASRSPPAIWCACPGWPRRWRASSSAATSSSPDRSATRSSPPCSDRGGVLDAGDLAAATAPSGPSAHEPDVADRTVWATPAPTHGPSLLDAVADAAARRRSGDAVPARAGGDRRRRRHARRPVGHVDRQRRRPRRQRASSSSTPTRIPATAAGSSSPTTTSSSPTAPAAASRPSPATPTSRSPAAGRRRRCTPGWCPTTDGGRALLGGTPGGDNQMPWNTQLLQGIIDGETAPGVAGDGAALGVAAGRRRRAHRGRLRRSRASGAWRLPRRVSCASAAGGCRARSRSSPCPRPARRSSAPPTRARSASPSACRSPGEHGRRPSRRDRRGGTERSPRHPSDGGRGRTTFASGGRRRARTASRRPRGGRAQTERLAEAADQPAGGGADADLRRAVRAERRAVRPKWSTATMLATGQSELTAPAKRAAQRVGRPPARSSTQAMPVAPTTSAVVGRWRSAAPVAARPGQQLGDDREDPPDGEQRRRLARREGPTRRRRTW